MHVRSYFGYAASALLAASVFASTAAAGPISEFVQTNLVSDVTGMAPVTDPDLKNPWGVSFTSMSPFWVSDQVTGKATLYTGAGTKQGLIVNMGSVLPLLSPTGQVSNSTSSFNSDLFLFSTLNGTIMGWRGALGTTAETLFNAPGTTYTGLASGAVSGTPVLYAADAKNGKIDVYNNTGLTTLSGNFVDPNIPAGFTPYNIQNINGTIYVTYAHKGSPGGFVSTFRPDGTLIGRLASNGPLNSPWGLALAPPGFGNLGGDLLIGNELDGHINVFDLSGNLIGTLADTQGNVITNTGLWSLNFGNGASAGGAAGSLFVTAGINNEADGLFARIDAVPEPGTLSLLMLTGLAVLLRSARRFHRE